MARQPEQADPILEKKINEILAKMTLQNDKMELVTEPGKYQIWVGGSSDSGIKGEFEVK